MSNKRKYPISVHNKQCIGPCYPPKTKIIHPVTMSMSYHNTKNLCPTTEWITDNNDIEYYDECLVPNIKDLGVADRAFYFPDIPFNPKFFLTVYYEIAGFDGIIKFLNTDELINTKKRIMECGWKIYGNTEMAITDDIINFYLELIKKDWIYEFMNKLSKYIQIEGDKIFIAKSTNDDHSIEKTNFLMKKIITKQSIFKILNQYIDSLKEVDQHDLEKIVHHDKIKKMFLSTFEEKIKQSI